MFSYQVKAKYHDYILCNFHTLFCKFMRQSVICSRAGTTVFSLIRISRLIDLIGNLIGYDEGVNEI